MRQAIDQSPTLDTISIEGVQINPRSKDTLDTTLRALQKIGSTYTLQEQVLSVLEKHLSAEKRQDTGRPGITYWRIFVLLIMKNSLDCGYSRIATLANSHLQLRQILQHATWSDPFTYSPGMISDNLSRVPEVAFSEFNPILVKLGVKRLRKFTEGNDHPAQTGIKADPPTDVRKVHEAIIRYMAMAVKASKAHDLRVSRQQKYLKRSLIKAYRVLSTSENYSRNSESVNAYLDLCEIRVKKCDGVFESISNTAPDSPWLSQLRRASDEISRLIDQVERDKLKITVLTNEYPPNIYGGAGVHVKYLARELSTHHRVQVFAFGRQRRHVDALSVKGISERNAPKGKDPRFNKLFGTLHCNIAMASAIERTDIIHCHTWYSHWAGFLAKQLTEAKLVLTAHSLEPHRPWKEEQLGQAYHVSSWIERTAYENADAIIAVSPQMKDDVIQTYGVREDRIHVIPNGIDLDEYRSTCNESLVESYGIDPNIPYVLFVGRITRQKGIIHLLDAVPHLDAGTQVVFAAGAADTPEIETEMIQKVDALKKDGNHPIVWIQEMIHPSELSVLYSHAQVFACPSVYEPFGIINLEAMACETAVVASNVGGIPTVVVHGETGLLVDPEGDDFPQRLGESINQLMRDPVWSQEMGRKGRVRVENQFSWETIAEKTINLYRSIL